MLQIDVTQDDIDAGEPYKECDCPIAKAIKRMWPDSGPVVLAETITITRDNARRSYATPDIAAVFMEAFDEGNPVRPFSFTL